MEKMLVVIFDEESKAYEGSRALNELDRDGIVAIHAESVIQKNADGTVTEKRTEGNFPIRTIGGTAIGSLIGLLGGPVGFGIGAAIGATTGIISDLYVAGVNADFLNDVSNALTPGKFAVLADVSEEWVTPVDTRMEGVGGVVLRTAKQHFEEEQWAREAAALRAEIDQLKAELAQARAERKAKIQAKIDELNKKLQDSIEQAKQRSEQLKSEADAKVKALQDKASKARHETKAAINARITEIREQYEQSAAKLRNVTAKRLRKAAAKLEKAG